MPPKGTEKDLASSQQCFGLVLFAQPLMDGKQGLMRAPVLLCLQEKAISQGADRGDTVLCNSWHGDHAAHRGECRLRLAGPLSPVLTYQQRGVWESVPVKDTHTKYQAIT